MIKPLIRLVDDDVELADSFVLLLETMGWSVKHYETGRRFLEEDDFSRPGCVVLDMRMPGMTGLEVQAALEAMGVKLPILFLSAHGTIASAVQAVRHGAVDFLEKPVEPVDFVRHVTKAVTASLAQFAQQAQNADIRSRLLKLTPRERDVLRRVWHGQQNKAVARDLGLEVSTVKMHRANAFAKLGVHSQSELLKLGFDAGLTPENDFGL